MMKYNKTKTSTNVIKGVGFEFVESGHSYYLDGKKLPGVTTILSVIAKPALIQWSANEAIKYVLENAIKIKAEVRQLLRIDDTFILTNELLLKEASVAHRKKKEEAGEKGTDVHALIEDIIKHAIEYTKGTLYPTEIPAEIQRHPQVKHFLSWAMENKVRFLASEERVFSRRLFLGGTIDFICKINDDVWIGDIKTSSSIYPEYFFQTAGYQKLLEDMAMDDGGMQLNVKGHVITCLKKDGTFEEKRSISNEDNLLAFMSALNLYRVTEKLKSNII